MIEKTKTGYWKFSIVLDVLQFFGFIVVNALLSGSMYRFGVTASMAILWITTAAIVVLSFSGINSTLKHLKFLREHNEWVDRQNEMESGMETKDD